MKWFKYRNAAHYLIGILMILGYLLHPIISFILLILWITYELNEDMHLSDQAFHDILESIIGASITVAGLLIWRFLL